MSLEQCNCTVAFLEYDHSLANHKKFQKGAYSSNYREPKSPFTDVAKIRDELGLRSGVPQAVLKEIFLRFAKELHPEMTIIQQVTLSLDPKFEQMIYDTIVKHKLVV